jgi:hypothetical protein
MISTRRYKETILNTGIVQYHQSLCKIEDEGFFAYCLTPACLKFRTSTCLRPVRRANLDWPYGLRLWLYMHRFRRLLFAMPTCPMYVSLSSPLLYSLRSALYATRKVKSFEYEQFSA